MNGIVNHHTVSIASKILLSTGIITILLTVGYAIFNLSNIDNFVTIWATFMIIGVCFSFIGLFADITLRLSQKK